MDEKQTQHELAYINHLLDRLLERYLEHGPIPGNEQRQMDVTLLHRLAFAVIAEGYGG